MIFGKKLSEEKTKKIKPTIKKIIRLIEPWERFIKETIRNSKKYVDPDPHGAISRPPENIEKIRSKYKPKYYAFSILYDLPPLETYLKILKQARKIKNKITKKQILNLIITIREIEKLEHKRKEYEEMALEFAQSGRPNYKKIQYSQAEFAKNFREPASYELLNWAQQLEKALA